MLRIKTSRKSLTDERYVVEEIAKFDPSGIKGIDQLQEIADDVFFNPVTEELYGYNYRNTIATASSMILDNNQEGLQKMDAFLQKINDNSFKSDSAMLAAGRQSEGNAFYYNYMLNVEQFTVNPKYIWKASFNKKDIKYTRYEIVERTDSIIIGKPAKGKKVIFELSNLNTVTKNTVFSTTLVELVESILVYIDNKVTEGIKIPELLKLTNVLSYVFVNMTGGLHNIVLSQYEEDLRSLMTDIFLRAQEIFDNTQKAAEEKEAEKAKQAAEREAEKAKKEAEKKAKAEEKAAQKAEREAQKAADKAAKQAEREAKKAERDAAKAAKEAEKAQKETAVIEETKAAIAAGIEMTKESETKTASSVMSLLPAPAQEHSEKEDNTADINKEQQDNVPFFLNGAFLTK